MLRFGKTKIVALALVLVSAVVTCVLLSQVAARRKARCEFSGCNMLYLVLAEYNRGNAERELHDAESGTNTSQNEIQILKQRLKDANAAVEKWSAHIRKYGHLHGTSEENITTANCEQAAGDYRLEDKAESQR